ncbi:hypothetical protein [Halocatena halophila]|uniref:hypothetical protein n=1 Tax=Halocatena halophila TaxID=2814576 RepID=UPI002ED67F61
MVKRWLKYNKSVVDGNRMEARIIYDTPIDKETVGTISVEVLTIIEENEEIKKQVDDELVLLSCLNLVTEKELLSTFKEY